MSECGDLEDHVFNRSPAIRVSFRAGAAPMSADILAIGMAFSNTFTHNVAGSTGGALVRGIRPGTTCGVFRTVHICRVPIDFRLLRSAKTSVITMTGSITFTPNSDASIGGGLVRRPGTNCGVTSSSIKFCAVSVDCRCITMA